VDAAVETLILGPKPAFLRDVPVMELIDAKVATAQLLTSLGNAENNDPDIEKEAARAVFNRLADPASSDSSKRNAVELLDTPESVRHLVTMLTAYDWDFINQANEIRSYVVAGLLEDCAHPDPRIRLKALELTGKIAEVGLFEERTVVRRENVTDEELNKQISERIERLKRLEGPKTEVVDAVFTEKSDSQAA
jgi:hypothetical protein